MTFWRISNHVDLSGEGGRRVSARWHTQGQPVVYLAATPAGALLEVLAHHLRLDELSDRLQWLEMAVEGKVQIAARPQLDEGWRDDLELTRYVGDVWLRDRAAALLEVPSALAPKTVNYLLNPRHPDAERVRVASVTRYALDARFRRSQN